jgi:intracellular sulfur oxidation DsrE/DsrF family protein
MIVRRDFLSVSGAVVALAGAASAPTAAAAPGGRWDRAAFEAILARPVRHRQVFASTRLEQGVVLHYMQNSLTAYAQGFGEGAGTLHVAAVLYGSSLVLAMRDAMWTKYRLADVLSDKPEHDGLGSNVRGYVTRVEEMIKGLMRGPDGEARPGAANPYAARVASLVKQGASFFVCNNALTLVATAIASKTAGGSPASVHDDLAAHLLEGAMLVPAGVAALNAAQEARFTLVQATLG